MVWFQNFKTDEPNFGWWTKLLEANKQKWLEEARESVKVALQEYLNSLSKTKENDNNDY